MQRLFGASLEEFHVGNAFGVGLGVFDGGGRVFDGNDPPGIGGQEEGEGANAGIGVDESLVAGEL